MEFFCLVSSSFWAKQKKTKSQCDRQFFLLFFFLISSRTRGVRASLRSFFAFVLLLIDVEVAQLVAVFGLGDHTEPIAEFVFLQELLRQVFHVTREERNA